MKQFSSQRASTQDTGGGPGGGPGGGGTLTGQQKCHNQVTPTARSGNMGQKLRGFLFKKTPRFAKRDPNFKKKA